MCFQCLAVHSAFHDNYVQTNPCRQIAIRYAVLVVMFLFATMSRPASHLMDTSGTLTTILYTAKTVGLATCYLPHYRGGKGGRCVGLTISPPSCANCHASTCWNPQGLSIFTFFLPFYLVTNTWKRVLCSKNVQALTP
jgi:hypothetical protein